MSTERLMLRPMTTLITRRRRYPDVLGFYVMKPFLSLEF
jgi:hypothetical protein